MMKSIFSAFLVFSLSTLSLEAQEILRGEVLDQSTGEALIGANVFIAGTGTGTVTEWDGSFQLKVDGLPVTLTIGYVGFTSDTVVIKNSKAKIKVDLQPSAILIETVNVLGSRISEKRRESPLTIESIDLLDIKESTSNDFYEGLGALKGVDLTTASMGFTVINTRGFNSTSPVRSLQIIDGVDNQSPGLNFSLGNFLGAPELDVLKVDLIQGASSAFYGPNAFNGVIDIQTKDPFLHPGLSVSIKYGERNLMKGELRYAHVFKNAEGLDKFAFKINGAYMRADDWEATNYEPTSQSETDVTNPGGYDAVNVYGDEFIYREQDYSGEYGRIEYPGLNFIARTGYAEKDLVDYNTENYKGNVGLYYKVNSLITVNGGFNFGSGTTVYQGENRFRLDDIFFWQGKLEIKQAEKFFLRAYMTKEDAGKSYDVYTTALRLQTSAKSNDEWLTDYRNYWIRSVRNKVKALEGYPPPSIPFNFEQQALVFAQNIDKLTLWHAEARNDADSSSPGNFSFFEPGTLRFDSMFNIITNNLANDQDNPGTRFYDKSGLYHVHGEYKFETSFANFTTGANFRQYSPDSKGTIFSDTMGVKITNSEYGIYAGAEKKLIPTKLKLNATMRVDKNENFDMLVSPAASFVYTPDIDNTFRISFSSAIRNPSLSDQYLNLDVGRAQLLGNISGYKNLITPESFKEYLMSPTLDTSLLVYFDEDAIQPEKVKSIEIGYRGILFNKVWVDAGYYYSWYKDFIGYKIGIRSGFNGNFPVNTRVLRIASNAESQVTTQGFNVGASYFLGRYYNLAGNYSWNILNTKGTDDPIIPAFNTPENKFNIGLAGINMPIDFFGTRLNNIGFNINYKWIEGFIFEGSPQFTGAIPTYDLLDAQINWTSEPLGLTIKLGATNVLNKKQFQTYGGPRIGRLAYISFLYQSKS